MCLQTRWKVGVVGLVLLSAVRAQNLTFSDDNMEQYLSGQKAMWDQYKNDMPSCDESIYLSQAGAEVTLSCLEARFNQPMNQSSGISCLQECNDVIVYYDIACKIEEAIVEAKLAKTWLELLDSNKTLPTGDDGKILERLFLLSPMTESPEDNPQSGVMDSEERDVLAYQNNTEILSGLFTIISQFIPDELNAYNDECIAGKGVVPDQSKTLLNDALEEHLRYQRAIWDQYKDAMPSCDESTYLSQTGAELELACLQAMRAALLNGSDTMMCYDECSNAISYHGIECKREEAAVGAQLGETWLELLDSNKTLPTGGDGKILEGIFALNHILMPRDSDPTPGFTNSGGSEFLANPSNMEMIKGLFSSLAWESDQFNEYTIQCMSEKSSSASHAIPKFAGRISVSALLLLLCMT